MTGTKAIVGFFAELQRRRVLHIGGVYIAGAWLGAEILTFLLEQAMAPAWAFRLLAIVFVVGFPVAMVLAWVIQIREDGSWAIDPSGGQRRTIMVAVALGLLATAGLSWLILPGTPDAPQIPAYQPIPNSVAILPLVETGSAPHERVVAQTLYTALSEGLNQSRELSLLRLRLKEPPEDLLAFGQSVKVAALLAGRIIHDSAGTRAELSLLDVRQGTVQWSQTFDWDPAGIMEIGTAIANGVLEAMELPALSRDKFTGTDNPDAYDAFLLGELHMATLNIEDLVTARDDFQRAIDLDSHYVLAYVGLAESIRWYIFYKSPEKSERQALVKQRRRALETAQGLDSESAAVISALGTMSGNRLLAIQSYEHALELDPNHAKSYYRLGRVMGSSAEWEKAERYFRKALDLDPQNADWRNDLSEVLYNQGRDEEAFAEVRKSSELEPELVFNHFKMGYWAAFDLGRLDEAIVHYRKAYALDPNYGNLSLYIAGTYGDLRAWKEALAWMEQGLEQSPGLPMVWYAYYQLYYSMGEKDKALEYLQREVEMSPDNSFSLHALGLLDIRQGRVELALDRWQQAYPVLTSGDDPEINENNLREAMYYAGNLMEAGETGKAEPLLPLCLDALHRWQSETFVRESMSLEFEQEIYAAFKLKKETLATMRRAIIDNQNYSGSWMYKSPAFEFLRDEPEFQELMEIFHTNLDEQLRRIRKMECNGELTPAPEVITKVACS